MVYELEIRKLGNSKAVILPKELLAMMNADTGDVLTLTQGGAPGEFRLQAGDPKFAKTMQIAEKVMRKYRNALKELAK
jgi:putative addiction module antidote